MQENKQLTIKQKLKESELRKQKFTDEKLKRLKEESLKEAAVLQRKKSLSDQNNNSAGLFHEFKENKTKANKWKKKILSLSIPMDQALAFPPSKDMKRRSLKKLLMPLEARRGFEKSIAQLKEFFGTVKLIIFI